MRENEGDRNRRRHSNRGKGGSGVGEWMHGLLQYITDKWVGERTRAAGEILVLPRS